MPATVKIKRVTSTTGAPVLTDVQGGSTRLNTADTVADGTANPIAVPTSGSNYSFFATFRLVCSVAPATEINSIRFYSDGTNSMGAGVDMNVSTVPCTNGNVASTYTQATGTAGTTGVEMVANYAHSITASADVFTKTSAAPLVVNGGFVTGVDTAADSAVGSFGDAVILQTKVGTTAGPGVTTSETFTYIYDEF